MERTFLVHSPRIDRIDVLRHGQVRRAKLFYLREKVGRRARIRERRSPVGGPDMVLLRTDDAEAAAEEAALAEPELAPDEEPPAVEPEAVEDADTAGETGRSEAELAAEAAEREDGG